MYKKVLLVIFIVLLVLGNIYFYNQAKKLDYAITIGKPVGSNYQTMGVNFYEPLSDRDDANLLIFSLMDGVSVDKPKVFEELPNLTVWFNDWEKNTSYYQANLWINENSIIIETNRHGDQPKYKIIDSSKSSELKKLIKKYTVKTYK